MHTFQRFLGVGGLRYIWGVVARARWDLYYECAGCRCSCRKGGDLDFVIWLIYLEHALEHRLWGVGVGLCFVLGQ